MTADERKRYRPKLRDKYEKEGIENMRVQEIFELLLSYTTVKDYEKTSEYLLNKFGFLNSIFDAELEYILKDDIIDKNSAILLKMIPRLSRLYTMNTESIKYINSVDDAKKYFSKFFLGMINEEVFVVCLDDNMKIVDSQIISYGSVNSVDICIREIVSLAMKNNSKTIIVAHNHPMSKATPSDVDWIVTKKLVKALRIYEIEIFDHIIVGLSGVESMREIDSSIFYQGFVERNREYSIN